MRTLTQCTGGHCGRGPTLFESLTDGLRNWFFGSLLTPIREEKSCNNVSWAADNCDTKPF